jgi:hypothetical protein
MCFLFFLGSSAEVPTIVELISITIRPDTPAAGSMDVVIICMAVLVKPVAIEAPVVIAGPVQTVSVVAFGIVAMEVIERNGIRAGADGV